MIASFREAAAYWISFFALLATHAVNRVAIELDVRGAVRGQADAARIVLPAGMTMDDAVDRGRALHHEHDTPEPR